MKITRNVPASVRQRLLNRARNDKRPFNELLQYYAMERFLYRLSGSAHADCFILKGALMLRVWSSSEFQPTMDIDMLGKTNNEEASIIKQIQDIMAMDVEPDGLTFDPDSIQSERITETLITKGSEFGFAGRWIQPGSACKSISDSATSFIRGQKNRIYRPCLVPHAEAPVLQPRERYRREVRSHGETRGVEQPYEGFL